MLYLVAMPAPLPNKTELIHQLLATLNVRKTGLVDALAAAKESRDNDTKSSAGDKFETGRAMMQQEMDKIEQQLHQLQQQIHQLQAIDNLAPQHQIGLGSLVQTDKNTYFLAIGLGKFDFAQQSMWVISTASPIAQRMLGKKVGDHFEFQQQGKSLILSIS